VVKRGAKDARLSVFIGWGQLTPDELVEAYADFLETGPTPLVLWDLSSASLAGMRSEDLRAVAKRAAELATDRRPPGRSALVVGPRDVEYGLARMLSAFLAFEKCNLDVEAFRAVDDAKAWLLEAQP
jgi:hypothetical protein